MRRHLIALGQLRERREKGGKEKWNATTDCACFSPKVPLWVFDGWQMESPRQREPGGAAPEDEPADEMSGAEMPAFFPDRDSGRTLRER